VNQFLTGTYISLLKNGQFRIFLSFVTKYLYNINLIKCRVFVSFTISYILLYFKFSLILGNESRHFEKKTEIVKLIFIENI